MSKKVLVPIANGSEEIEASCIIDTLRRADAEVTVAAVGGDKQVKCSREVLITADRLIEECTEEYDLVALPGGMPGAENLKNCEKLTEILKNQKNSGKFYAAICASPAVVLQAHGLLEGKKATCYPAMQEKLDNPVENEKVVIDGNCITSQGPGTALLFALELLGVLCSENIKEETAKAMLVEL